MANNIEKGNHEGRIKKIEDWEINHDRNNEKWMNDIFEPYKEIAQSNRARINAILWLLGILLSLNLISIGILIILERAGM